MEIQINKHYDAQTLNLFIVYFIILGNNLYDQIILLESNDKVTDLLLKVSYWMMVIISMLLLLPAYYKSNLQYLRYSYTIIGIRNILSMHDFEGIKQDETSKPLHAVQILVVTYYLLQLIHSTRPSKFKIFQKYFLPIFLSSGLLMGYRQISFKTFNEIAFSVGMIFVGSTINFAFYRI